MSQYILTINMLLTINPVDVSSTFFFKSWYFEDHPLSSYGLVVNGIIWSTRGQGYLAYTMVVNH